MTTLQQRARAPRIVSVTVHRVYDEAPDTSWIGEYGDKDQEGAIPRFPCEECNATGQTMQLCEECNGTGQLEDYEVSPGVLGVAPCDECPGTGERMQDCPSCEGTRSRVSRGREYLYFYPATAPGGMNYDKTLPPEESSKYAQQDFERMESLSRGDWSFVGVTAEAVVAVPSGNGTATLQRIHSGGLWGIESDSGENYFAEEEDNQLSELSDQLLAIGLSKRAVRAAIKNAERKGVD